MGPPPVLGNPATTGKSVAVAWVFADVAAGVSSRPQVFRCCRCFCVVGPCARQPEPVMVLESRVTAPVCARARPFKLAPVCRLMDVRARIFPTNEVPVPSVAELTTRHHTLQGSPPTTDEPDDVVRAAADLKIQTPDPLRVSTPDKAKASAQ